ncbi:MAG: hypothetical protein K0R19_2581 [Bacillota bacterium]|nr:hypothetical protein [Bacillota bacterium]
MSKKAFSRSQLFLIELIVVVLFFSFSAAIAMMVFGKAHELSEDAKALNGAMAIVQSAAETDRSKSLDEVRTNSESIYLNENWVKSTEEDAEYLLKVEIDLEDRPAGAMALLNYIVSDASDAEDIIYTLETKKYYSGQSGIGSAGEVN